MKEIISYLEARYLNQKAQGMVEYAVILGVVVVIALGLSSGGLGKAVNTAFNVVSNKISNITF